MNKYKVGETAPPFHVNCRSTTIPYFDDEFTKDETRASREENDESYIPIPANIKYSEWKEKIGISNNPEMYERYANVLRELAPANGAEFDKIRQNPAEWDLMKYQYRILNMYDAPEDVSAKKILELHNDAYYTKKKGFDVDRFTGATKRDAQKLSTQGNAAVMQVGDLNFYSHSQFDMGNSLADMAYNGNMTMIAEPKTRMFKTFDVNGIVRDNCTEVKFLEFVASRSKPTDADHIVILSEKHICASCSDVVKQFKEKFPNMQLNIVSGKKGYNNDEEGRKTWRFLGKRRTKK